MYHDKHESYGWYYIASMNYLVIGNLSCAKTFTDGSPGQRWITLKDGYKDAKEFYREDAIKYVFTEIVQK